MATGRGRGGGRALYWGGGGRDDGKGGGAGMTAQPIRAPEPQILFLTHARFRPFPNMYADPAAHPLITIDPAGAALWDTVLGRPTFCSVCVIAKLRGDAAVGDFSGTTPDRDGAGATMDSSGRCRKPSA